MWLERRVFKKEKKFDTLMKGERGLEKLLAVSRKYGGGQRDDHFN